MNYCKDCRHWSRLYAFPGICTNPTVLEANADPVFGVPPRVLAVVARSPHTSWPGSGVCGKDGFLFEKRESLTYRFFLWLFGGPAKGRNGGES